MNQLNLIVVRGRADRLVTAAGAAALGARVALVERDRLGGECLWSGCVPGKARLACRTVAADTWRARQFGVIADPDVDFAGSMRWARGAVATIASHDSPERFLGSGVDVISGTARFTGAVRTLPRWVVGRSFA